MAAAQFSTYKLIRDLWPQKSIYEALLDNSPTLGIFKKDTNFGEKIRYIGVGYGAPQGIGGAFGDAKQFKTASKAVEFQVQKGSYYGAFSIEGLLWRTYKLTGNKAIIVDPLARESKNLMRQMKNDLSSYIHGDGIGALGRLTSGSSVASATVTLTASADIRRIEPGMALQTESTGATGGSLNAGYVTVASIGGTETAPTITVDQASWTAGIAASAASDYVYRFGVYDSAVPLKGLDAWNPSHSGSPGTFLSVNRNLYANRLAGRCLTATTMSPRQRVLRAARMVADVGGNADTYLMSTRQWENLANELQSANMLKFSKVPAAPIGKLAVGVSYEAIEIMGPTGRLEVFADPWMSDSVERCGQRDTCTLASLGDLVHWDDDASPGNPMLEDAADAREVRAVGDMAFYNECPAYWVRVAVS